MVITCGRCDGTGYLEQDDGHMECPQCEGEGYVEIDDPYDDSDFDIRYPGEWED